MIENKTVYEWAKEERDSIKDYLSRYWNYAHDVDFENDDDGLLYKKHCEDLYKQYKFLSNVLEWQQDDSKQRLFLLIYNIIKKPCETVTRTAVKFF